MRRARPAQAPPTQVNNDDDVATHFDKLLAPVPLYLRKGPVSPAAPLAILAVAAALLHEWPLCVTGVPAAGAELAAVEAVQLSASWPIQLQTLQFSLFAYGLAVIGYMWKTVGLWPMCSYTLTSWNLQTVRLGLLSAPSARSLQPSFPTVT